MSARGLPALDEAYLSVEFCNIIRQNDANGFFAGIRDYLSVVGQSFDSLLFCALYCNHLHMAEAILPFKGAMRQNPLSSAWLDEQARYVVPFLLKHGFRIPKIVLLNVPLHIDLYFQRHWTFDNHDTWPTLLREQVVTILCALARTRCTLPALVLQHLFCFLVPAHRIEEA